MPKEQQAIEIKRLFAAEFSMSSWVAANIDHDTNDVVRIPRDIAEKSAGWNRLRGTSNANPAPPQTPPEANT